MCLRKVEPKSIYGDSSMNQDKDLKVRKGKETNVKALF